MFDGGIVYFPSSKFDGIFFSNLSQKMHLHQIEWTPVMSNCKTKIQRITKQLPILEKMNGRHSNGHLGGGKGKSAEILANPYHKRTPLPRIPVC